MMGSLDPKSSNYEQGSKVLRALRTMKENEEAEDGSEDDESILKESSRNSSAGSQANGNKNEKKMTYD